MEEIKKLIEQIEKMETSYNNKNLNKEFYKAKLPGEIKKLKENVNAVKKSFNL